MTCILESSVFITFIIPSIGRDSLIDTIKSLYNLIDKDWYAIIIFDGIRNNELSNHIINIDVNNKIKIIYNKEHIGNQSVRNSAGVVRNIGISSIDFITQWIGFVDDDDTLSPYYIQNLKNEIEISPNIEVCIFRMIYENGCVLPSKYDRNILRGKVGISFALKFSLNPTFTNNPFEDFILLKYLQNNGIKMLISSHISYYVRCKYDYNSIKNIYPKIFL